VRSPRSNRCRSHDHVGHLGDHARVIRNYTYVVEDHAQSVAHLDDVVEDHASVIEDPVAVIQDYVDEIRNRVRERWTTST
jgi:hypothetical protein